jgi:glycosyltransferase involved in cell wall biosynthesis
LSIDLVLATVGRTDELERFLRSLAAQAYRDFRVLVVDQNPDDRLDPLLGHHRALQALVLKSKPGLSRARNVALDYIEGDIVAFPDDDCWYPPQLLAQVATSLGDHREWDGLAGRAVDDAGKPSTGHLDDQAGPITTLNLWRRVSSCTLFLRRSVIEAVGGFDESLGIGAGTPWGAAEDLDYAVRSVARGFSLHYDPTLRVHHPQKREGSHRPDARQGYAYGAGFGRTLRKNGLPSWFAVYCLARSYGAAGLNLVAGRPARARFFWEVGRGRTRGWLRGSGEP